MQKNIEYFDKPGAANTEETLNAAKQRADQLGIKTIVVATSSGATAVRATEIFKNMKVVAVTHNTGFREPNLQELTEENRRKILDNKGLVLTATHLFRGIGGAIFKKYNTPEYVTIVANTLRTLGQGMKVCVEIGMMAADAGMVRTDEDIIAIAGSATGADYAIVFAPVNSNNFFDLKVKEIICKPRY